MKILNICSVIPSISSKTQLCLLQSIDLLIHKSYALIRKPPPTSQSSRSVRINKPPSPSAKQACWLVSWWLAEQMNVQTTIDSSLTRGQLCPTLWFSCPTTCSFTVWRLTCGSHRALFPEETCLTIIHQKSLLQQLNIISMLVYLLLQCGVNNNSSTFALVG